MANQIAGHCLETNKEWLDLASEYSLRTWAKHPIVLERAKGCKVWDVEGKEYLDMMSGQLCVSVGPGHPQLLEAINQQAQRIMQTGSAFSAPEEIALAKRLADLAPGDLQKSFFGCSGSESNETAMRIARFATGRQEMASLSESYHGLTFGSWSVTGRGYRSNHPEYGLGMPGVTFLPTPNPYRCLFCRGQGACDLTCFQYSQDLMDKTTTGQPAAIIIEPILGGPIVVPSREYMQELRRFCTERDILLIADEALTGLGRTGKWFASEHFDIVPDIMTMSKSLGGAVPLSATIVTDAIAEKLESGGYYQSSSHTGDPFLCGVGLANLDIIEEEGLVGNAERMGAYFKSGLEELRNQYEIVGDVRGLGLLLGLEIVRDKESAEPAIDLMRHIEDYCLDRGLILFTTGGTPIIRLAPPLVITRAEIDTALTIMEEAIRSAAEGGGG